MTAPSVAPPRSTTTAPHRRRNTAERTRSAAVQRAYARRAQRTGGAPAARVSAAPVGSTPFVVLVMVLLAISLVATLWLSTAAAGDSYRLQSAQDTARNLAERSEQLSREVAGLETAPELARRARELGMVPAGDPARLLVAPNGAVTMVGKPHQAVASAPPASPQPVAPAPASPLPGNPPPAAAAAQAAPAPAQLPSAPAAVPGGA